MVGYSVGVLALGWFVGCGIRVVLLVNLGLRVGRGLGLIGVVVRLGVVVVVLGL